LLSTLLYQSELSLTTEEQHQIRELVEQQRNALSSKQDSIDSHSEVRSEIKAITEDLLEKLNQRYQPENLCEDD